MSLKQDIPTPEHCPEPFWHETHRYCPRCTWTEARPVSPEAPDFAAFEAWFLAWTGRPFSSGARPRYNDDEAWDLFRAGYAARDAAARAEQDRHHHTPTCPGCASPTTA